MAYYVVVKRRIIETVYLVEGNPEQDSFGDNGKYLWSIDADDSNFQGALEGPYDTEEEAIANTLSYEEGR